MPTSVRPLVAGLLLAFAAAPAWAQDARVLTVAVADARTGAALPGASVALPALGRGAAADAAGAARIDALPADTLAVTVSFVGYAPARRTADLRAGDARLEVRLEPDARALGAVEVTADAARARLTRDVRPVAVLEGADLEAARGATLGATLAELNGVTVLSTGPSIAKPVLRGLHSDRVVVVVGGVRQEGQQWGGEHAPEVDPFAPARIEVIRGAAGVEVGAGAIGGVVRIEERALPTAPGVAGRLSAQAFSNAAQGALSAYAEGASAAVPGLAARVQLSARRSGDARTPDYVLRNSAYAEMAGSAAVGYTAGPLAVEAHARRFATALGIYRGAHFGTAADLEAILARGGPDPAWDYGFSYAIDRPRQEIVHDTGALRARLALPRGDRLEATVAVQENRRQEFDNHRRFNDDTERAAFDLTLQTTTADLVYRLAPRGRVAGAFGLSGLNQGNVGTAQQSLVPNFRALSGGAFAHVDVEAARGLALEAGLRADARWQRAFPFNFQRRDFDRDVRTYTGLSGALGALADVAPGWTLAASLGTAWRPPGVNELYAFGVHHGTALFEVGNAALRPERALDASLTLRHEGPRVSAEAALYRNRIDGFLYERLRPEPTVTLRGTFPVADAAQTDAVLRGLDAQATWRAAAWLDLSASASVLRADHLDGRGPLGDMPADRARLSARLHAPALRLPALGHLAAPFVEVDALGVRRQTRTDPTAFLPAPPPPGYALVGIRAGADVPLAGRTAALALGIDNLFDVAYRDALSRFRFFADEPGRNVSLTLSVPFGRADASL